MAAALLGVTDPKGAGLCRPGAPGAIHFRRDRHAPVDRNLEMMMESMRALS
jgi:hypothetical protein